MTAGTRHRDGLVMAGRAPRVSFSETLLQIPSSTILKKIEHNNTATRWFQRTQILSLKNTSFSAIQIWKIKIINPSFNETFPQASHRMTREKCSTKGAKAGCKAKDSWLLWGKILGAVLCTLEVREPQLKKRVWSWQFFFATQRRDDPRDDFVPKKNIGIASPPDEQTISILLTPTKLWRHFPVHILRVLDQATANRSLTQQSWKKEPYNPWYFAQSQPFPGKIWVLSSVESYALSWDVWKGLHLASDTSMLKLILMHNRNRRPQMEKTKSLLLPVKRSTVSTRLTNYINCRHVGPGTSFTFSASEIVT